RRATHHFIHHYVHHVPVIGPLIERALPRERHPQKAASAQIMPPKSPVQSLQPAKSMQIIGLVPHPVTQPAPVRVAPAPAPVIRAVPEASAPRPFAQHARITGTALAGMAAAHPLLHMHRPHITPRPPAFGVHERHIPRDHTAAAPHLPELRPIIMPPAPHPLPPPDRPTVAPVIPPSKLEAKPSVDTFAPKSYEDWQAEHGMAAARPQITPEERAARQQARQQVQQRQTQAVQQRQRTQEQRPHLRRMPMQHFRLAPRPFFRRR
ncbi:MAG: hypothetical protein KGQ42_10515, partial [Alphaproteobacteria bacterium]|nr:hypothetical protein [Alphaproteobacteria bacterium]